MFEWMVAGGILPPGIEFNCIAFNTIPGGKMPPATHEKCQVVLKHALFLAMPNEKANSYQMLTTWIPRSILAYLKAQRNMPNERMRYGFEAKI